MTAADLSEVLPPLAILVTAVAVVVVTVLVTRDEGSGRAAKRTGGGGTSVQEWRNEHGRAVDQWVEAYDERLSGLPGALAGRSAIGLPEPVDRLLDLGLEHAAEASPDLLLARHLRTMQASAQAALVATVAGRLPIAGERYERHLSERAVALDRLGALLADPSLAAPHAA